MTNFFTSLFSKSKASDINNVNVAEQFVPIPEDRFRDTNPPVVASKFVDAKSGVFRFLNADYLTMGQSDGFNFHNSEYMTQKCNSMASEFRNLIDAEMELLHADIQKLMLHQVSIKGHFEMENEIVRIKISEKERKLDELFNQKSLSVEFDGYIGKPINDYRLGFQQGLRDYLLRQDFMKTNIMLGNN